MDPVILSHNCSYQSYTDNAVQNFQPGLHTMYTSMTFPVHKHLLYVDIQTAWMKECHLQFNLTPWNPSHHISRSHHVYWLLVSWSCRFIRPYLSEYAHSSCSRLLSSQDWTTETSLSACTIKLLQVMLNVVAHQVFNKTPQYSPLDPISCLHKILSLPQTLTLLPCVRYTIYPHQYFFSILYIFTFYSIVILSPHVLYLIIFSLH